MVVSSSNFLTKIEKQNTAGKQSKKCIELSIRSKKEKKKKKIFKPEIKSNVNSKSYRSGNKPILHIIIKIK